MDAGADAGADAAAGPVGQGGAARGALAVNEVAPQPATGPDWIELVNRGDDAVDLCDYFVTDSLDRLDHYAPLGGVAPPGDCPPRLLDPGARAVVIADDTPPGGGDGGGRPGDPAPDAVVARAPFRLGEADEVHVVTATGVAEDSLIYLYPAGGPAGASLARVPDGEGPFYPAPPTPGAANPADVSGEAGR